MLQQKDQMRRSAAPLFGLQGVQLDIHLHRPEQGDCQQRRTKHRIVGGPASATRRSETADTDLDTGHAKPGCEAC
ncbi:hypothetical protein CTA1_8639 [Colletotrichum tanaceti]|uniref:Uncharacterized protein n=1 Tax=Colletotrichum tanaceti TaxID=1306861 RepID=A0A4U6XSJ6_9PEZI|nr:hypothetical protein CTA1_8639 [Colletotrichum tanaceti]